MQRYQMYGRGSAGYIRKEKTGAWCKFQDHLQEISDQHFKNKAAVAVLDDLLYKVTEALIEMAMMHGGKHEKNCPQDDTCDCGYAAFNKMVNDAVKAALDHFNEIGRKGPSPP